MNPGSAEPSHEAVVFDLDGVLIDSEPVWEEVRRAVVAEYGGQWLPDTQNRLMGMSTSEWAAYLSGELGVQLPPSRVAEVVVDRVAERYGERLPLMDGAVEVVQRMAARWPLGLASSSPPRLITLVLERSGMARFLGATVSTEEVARGKPAPDVYLEVTRRLRKEPPDCVAVEDSSNGIRSAIRAGLAIVAVPHPRYPLDQDATTGAGAVLPNLWALTPEVVEALPPR